MNEFSNGTHSDFQSILEANWFWNFLFSKTKRFQACRTRIVGKAIRRRNNFLFRLIWFTIILTTIACAPTKYLSRDSRIHQKSKIRIEKTSHIKGAKKIRSNLQALTQKSPKYGIWKWRLGLHLKTGEPKKKKGLKNWLKNKIGKQPVYFSSSNLENSRLRMEKYLFDQGFFKAIVQTDTSVNKNFVTSEYSIIPGAPYRLGKIDFKPDTGALIKIFETANQERYLKSNDIYTRDNLLRERDRLFRLAADNGYLDVSKQNFLFLLDTIPKEAIVDVYIQLDSENDELSLEPYIINQTWVFQDYSLMAEDNEDLKDTVHYKGINLIQESEILRPKALKRIISQDEGDIYSKTQTDRTLNKFLDLGIYKFVNIKHEKTGPGLSRGVDRYVYLTPGVIRDISAELRANTRTGNYLGTGVIFSYTDRNILRGAERFDVSISGSLETQLGEGKTFLNTAESGVRLNLLLPYTWPFSMQNSNNLFNPKTQINLSYKYEKRFEFYSLSSLSFQFGYDWQSSLQKRHQLYPFVVNQIKVIETTERLENVLLENPSLRSSFEDVLISGAQYVYTYTNHSLKNNRASLLFKLNLETSGNIIYAVNSIFKDGQNKPFKFLGLPSSQFLKADLDLRYNLRLGQDNLVMRFFYGIGMAYGNSHVLPYVKQYYSGGSNGIRAFQIRTLGPGSYRNPASESGENEFIDQTGDLKLEANVEYRFPIAGYLKGAFFMDMGNIWLLKDDLDSREGGVFVFRDFLKEIALGTGFGLRLDINSFVLRLDAAFPLRKPFLPDGQKWVVDEINFFSKDWRSDNLVWNLALGYPF